MKDSAPMRKYLVELAESDYIRETGFWAIV